MDALFLCTAACRLGPDRIRIKHFAMAPPWHIACNSLIKRFAANGGRESDKGVPERAHRAIPDAFFMALTKEQGDA